MQQGDIVALKQKDARYGVFKILRIDTPEEGASAGAYHCLCYQPAEAIPEPEDVASLAVFSRHIAMDSAEMKSAASVIGHVPVTDSDLDGYYRYLQEHDYLRFIREYRAQNEAILIAANEHFQRGNRLAESQYFEQAITAYTMALDIFPHYIEALDNRGLTRMDFGDYEEAIADFQLSLSLNSQNVLSLFSMGECHLALKNFAQAERIFAACVARRPNEESFQEYLQKARDLQRDRGSAFGSRVAVQEEKPWWKIW